MPKRKDLVFYKEWFPLPKGEFRILAMLADKGQFSGNLSDLCRYFFVNPQTRTRNRLQELETFIEEIKAEAETIKDSIKAEMLDRDIEELAAGQYIVRWTSILSNRFDTTSFKKQFGDLYKSFTKQTSSRRFSISC